MKLTGIVYFNFKVEVESCKKRYWYNVFAQSKHMSLCICLQLRREKEKEELLNEPLGDSWLLHVGRTDGDRKLEHPYIRLIFPSVHLTQSVLTAGISLHLSLSLLFLFIYLFIL